MKNIAITLLFALFLFSESVNAQAPQGFSYQAVARDLSDDIVKNQFVSIRFWIIQGNGAGNVVYREVHDAVYTGQHGVMTLTIGHGVPETGTFSNIDWGSNNHFVRVDMDINNGTNFDQMGTSQLLTVPYAMFAQTSGDSGGGGDDWGNQVIQHDNSIIGDGSPGNPIGVNANVVDTDEQILSLNGSQLSISNGNTVSIPTGGTDADADPTNEIQSLGVNGNFLSISDGNTVTLPQDGDGNSNNELQQLSFNSGQLSISNGNTISIPTGGTDADADPTNEIQSLNLSGNTLSISDGNSVTFPTDNDTDPGNELQTITTSRSGNDVSLDISNGNTTTFSVNDSDSDSSNEFQNINANKSGEQVSIDITDGNSTSFDVRDNDADSNNELQDLSGSQSGDDITINISNGQGVTFDVRDSDSNPNNELQDLSINGSQLSISNGNTVNLPSSSLWTPNPQFFGIHFLNEVSVGSDDVFGELNVNGRGVFFNTSNATRRTTIGSSTIDFQGDNGNTNLALSGSGRGRVELSENGSQLIILDKASSGGGFVGLTNRFGSRTVSLQTNANNGVGEIITNAASIVNSYNGFLNTNPENGFFSVADGSSNNQAGMFVDANGNGVVFADIKNFRMDYPGKANQEIWYASLEGPEAGAYERGSASLVNGEAFVPYSDHFSMITAEKGRTIILTPLSASSEGLAVTRKTNEGFYVKELRNGNGNYSFDWETKAVRKGYEDFEVVRDRSYAQPGMSVDK